MCAARSTTGGKLPPNKGPAFRHLIESALRKVAVTRSSARPNGRNAWLQALADALVFGADASYQRVIASMIASGIREDVIFESYLPEVAAILGERWLADEASFVDVSIGGARLQEFIRSREEARQVVRDRLIPLGQSVLMVIPVFEQHALGAFLAANQFRQAGLWAHVAIGLDAAELVEQLHARRFSMIGISIGSYKSIPKTSELIHHIRENVENAPPIVLGGVGVLEDDGVLAHSGADIIARSAQEAVEQLGLVPMRDPYMAGLPE